MAQEALDCLLQVNNEEWRQQHEYLSWLARCHIMTGSPHLAWDVYQNLSGSSAKDSIHLLQLIANDCYRMGYFFYAAKVRPPPAPSPPPFRAAHPELPSGV